ncbi:hypothetical protein C7B61_02025 [filamentous cyanobacterium CCP1]|nr:hypothetical protein C7B61_02025 [filamentous cyanobacterium CCP1]
MNQIKTLKPIAVIANTQLPDINGHHLIQGLRQNPATKHLKIITLVPLQASPQGNKPQVAGADACLVQPIRPDRLLQAVMSLTE